MTAPNWTLGDKTQAFGIKSGSRSSLHHRGEGGERWEEPLSHQSSADSPCEAVSQQDRHGSNDMAKGGCCRILRTRERLWAASQGA